MSKTKPARGPGAVKLATCCYCGARTMLHAPDGPKRVLNCGACGAPLRQVKAVPVAAPSPKAPMQVGRAKPPPRKRKRSRRRSERVGSPVWSRLGRKIVRAVEDLVDELDDILD